MINFLYLLLQALGCLPELLGVISLLILFGYSAKGQQSTPDSTSGKTHRKMVLKTRGFTDITTVGLFIPADGDATSFNFETSNGYQFNRRFTLCGTVADSRSYDGSLLAFSLNPRLNLQKNRLTTAVSANAGYATETGSNYRAAVLGFDISHEYYLTHNLAILCSAGVTSYTNSSGAMVVLLLKTGLQL